MKRFLDLWISRRIGAEPLTREAIRKYQLNQIKKTLEWAVNRSPFYKTRYQTYQVEDLATFEKLPFTCAEDVKSRGLDMVCTPQSEIARIVTLDTSGTTGLPKRIYFTEEDQELTIDFFHNGMQLMADETDRVMILMPCRRPGSVGQLLKAGLERIGASVVPYGLPEADLKDAEKIIALMEQEQVTCVVALAGQLAQISEMAKGRRVNLRSVLLSAEYVSEENRRKIAENFQCPVFEHFGMTETGLGGAVSCQMLEGYHPREADLYFEIVDPKTGLVLPEGELGELVVTTLTRKGMPFIRYKTGDMSRWLTDPCPCGSVLKRLDWVGDRGMEKGGLCE